MLHLTWMQASPSNHGGAETRIATNGPARRRALPDPADAQRYKHFSTGGIGTLKPWVYPGASGRGIKFVDLEYGWQLEIPASRVLAGDDTPSDPNPTADINHGTVVLGEIDGTRKSYGVTGHRPAFIHAASGEPLLSAASPQFQADRALLGNNLVPPLVRDNSTYGDLPQCDLTSGQSRAKVATNK